MNTIYLTGGYKTSMLGLWGVNTIYLTGGYNICVVVNAAIRGENTIYLTGGYKTYMLGLWGVNTIYLTGGYNTVLDALGCERILQQGL